MLTSPADARERILAAAAELAAPHVDDLTLNALVDDLRYLLETYVTEHQSPDVRYALRLMLTATHFGLIALDSPIATNEALAQMLEGQASPGNAIELASIVANFADDVAADVTADVIARLIRPASDEPGTVVELARDDVRKPTTH